jgi:hypothetical protein
MGGYIDNPDSRSFAHFTSSQMYDLATLVKNQVTPASKGLHLIVPGIFRPGDDGKLQLQIPYILMKVIFALPSLTQKPWAWNR